MGDDQRAAVRHPSGTAERPGRCQLRQNVRGCRVPPSYLNEFLPGTPIRYQSEDVGHLYLAKSEPGQEFTREAEATLVLFASQTTSPPNRSVNGARTPKVATVTVSPLPVPVLSASDSRRACR